MLVKPTFRRQEYYAVAKVLTACSCRYMKSIFPQPDETVILDVLTCNDNDIQKTSEALKKMGFERKDTVKAAKAKQAQKLEKETEEKAAPAPLPKIKSLEEKEKSNFAHIIKAKSHPLLFQ